jgi:CDK-activating kinase assembly factor MAT1
VSKLTLAVRFDKQESDFESLLDYNDYLETVEEVSWNLILGIDVEATREKMRRYEEARKAELNPNAAVRRPDEPDTSTLSDKSHVVLKKGGKQKKMLSSSANAPNPATAVDDDAGFTFRGLKKPKAPEPEKPFDPFGGWSIEPQRYVLQNDYTGHLFFADILQKPWHYGGGYDMHEYYSHAMCDAFGGIGIFIEDEMAAKEAQGSGDAGFGTQMAAAAAATTVAGGRDVDMADIF